MPAAKPYCIRFDGAGWLCSIWLVLACRGTPDTPSPTPSPKPAAPVAQRGSADRDITIPPPDVDVHVINGRNIISVLLNAGSKGEQAGGNDAKVRVTFWTTPDGQKLDTPQFHEGTLEELQLSALDLPMLAPGEKRRFWIPGPQGMATLDVELP
jgi:hypothetical protein